LLSCQRETGRREALVRASDGGTYLRGLTLFLGDLTTRIQEKDIIEALPDLIGTLLNKPNVENVKSISVVMKVIRCLSIYKKG